MDKPYPSDDERLKLRRHIERIRQLCSEVIVGYTNHCLSWYGHPVKQHNLDKIQLKYEQRIQRRCAEYNLTILEEKQWDPPNLKSDGDDEVDLSGEESEEHESDVVNIYTTSEDDDSSDDEPLEEPVLRDRQYKGFRPGDCYDSYDPDDLSDVSVPSDEEGIKAFMAECTLDAHNERRDLHCNYSLRLGWAEHQAFERRVMIDERIRKMKRDRIEQLESRAYHASLTEEEKAEFYDIHNWGQSLTEEERRDEVNLKKTPAEICAEMSKRRREASPSKEESAEMSKRRK